MVYSQEFLTLQFTIPPAVAMTLSKSPTAASTSNYKTTKTYEYEKDTFTFNNIGDTSFTHSSSTNRSCKTAAR